ncbi:MAG: hypothetical protein KME54_25150 [Tolypothrix brevis GSE-NOS-MK-07-07A]|nr:hypothetical protein [Tolypothrix brevis GSE-NOS-MK-07-07A]
MTISKNKTGLGGLVGVNRTVAQLYKQIASNLALHRDICKCDCLYVVGGCDRICTQLAIFLRGKG